MDDIAGDIGGDVVGDVVGDVTDWWSDGDPGRGLSALPGYGWEADPGGGGPAGGTGLTGDTGFGPTGGTGGTGVFVDPAEDAVTLTDERGMSVLSDTDGDGVLDHASVVEFSGAWSAWRRLLPGTPGAPDVTGSAGADGAPDVPGAPDGDPAAPGTAGADGDPVDPGAAVVPGTGGWHPAPGRDPGHTLPPNHPSFTGEIWDAAVWTCVEKGTWG
ncbi:DUF6802 family protein [Corynebacterium bovis]|uniref:DUF6802 family protein n=3 Tax=Corynebacterium bovis TaxID=36808 RepID=UPI000F6308F6|nr:DUF6802 family protein [Corynebacterium bovis]